MKNIHPAIAYYNRGLDKIQLHQFDKAVADLENAIKLDANLESKLRPIINKLKTKKVSY